MTSSLATETTSTGVASSLVGSGASSSAAPRRQPPPVVPPAATTRAATSTPPTVATVIARPPINAYLKMAVLRDVDDDGITCEDPERFGRRKYIAMSQLHQRQKQKQQQRQHRQCDRLKSESDANTTGNEDNYKNNNYNNNNSNNNNSNNSSLNKKEIPVPTITTVHRYNTDIPCTFNIPSSYIRHTPITYDEIYYTTNNGAATTLANACNNNNNSCNNNSNNNNNNNNTRNTAAAATSASTVVVEYNIDYDDEYWWTNNIDFGPYAKARIINPTTTTTAAATANDKSTTTNTTKSSENEKEEDNIGPTSTSAAAVATSDISSNTAATTTTTTTTVNNNDEKKKIDTTDDDRHVKMVDVQNPTKKKQLQHQGKDQAVAVVSVPTINTTTNNNNKSSKNKRNSRPGPRQRAALAAAAAEAEAAAAATEMADTTAMIMEKSTVTVESLSNENKMMDIDEMTTTTTNIIDISETNNMTNNIISSSSITMPQLQSQPSSTLSSTAGADININTTTATSSSATITTHHDKLTIEDVILMNPKYLYSQYTTKQLLRYYNPKLPLVIFEQMLDVLEKATGYETIVTLSQAESILCHQLPNLLDIFGPLVLTKDDDIFSSSSSSRSSMLDKNEEEHDNSTSIPPLPTLARPITLSETIQRVYTYWLNKRSRLRKPLLRRYWPVISSSDVNPHQVFRIRAEKEQNKRRLRKKRHNDIETYRKMKQLQLDMKYKLGVLCDLITKREEVNKTIIDLSNIYFEQRLRGWIGGEQVILTPAADTATTTTMISLDKDMIENLLLNVPKYFDDRPIVRTRAGGGGSSSSNTGGGNNNKRKRGSVGQPIMTDMIHEAFGSGGNMKSYGGGGGQHRSSILPPPPRPPPRNIVVAGHDDGYPAPNFLQPLASRESHFVTSWDYDNNSSINVGLSMPSYINGILTTTPPTAAASSSLINSHSPSGGGGGGGSSLYAGVGVESFRHRPRLGRGGRIIIDRVPMVQNFGNCSSSSSSSNAPHHKPPPTVITYGSQMRRFGTSDNNNNNNVLVNGEYTNPHHDLLLKPSFGDTTALTRKIEEICALGLMEDYHTARSNSTSSSSNNRNKGGGTSNSGGTAAAILSNSGSLSTGIMPVTTTATKNTVAMEEMDEVLIPIQDWFEAPESMKIYGSEKFVIGPL